MSLAWLNREAPLLLPCMARSAQRRNELLQRRDQRDKSHAVWEVLCPPKAIHRDCVRSSWGVAVAAEVEYHAAEEPLAERVAQLT